MGSKLTEEKASQWLSENAPHIKILEWSGAAGTRSKFIDLNRDVKFVSKFTTVKNSLLKNSGHTFNATKEEVNRKRKKTNLERYGFECSLQNKKVREKVKKTNLERYGVENVFQNKEIQERSRQTNLERYGVEHSLQNKEVREKMKQTNLERYGAENVFQNKEVKDKIKQTNFERYGVEYVSQASWFKESVKRTSFERYGVENPSQNKEVKEKIKQTNLERYGFEWSLQNKEVRDKGKQTNLERYGVEYPQQNKEVQERQKQTNLERYGSEYAFQNKEVREKIKQTKIDNGSTTLVDGKSLPEWAKDSNIGSYSTLLIAHKMGIHPSEIKSYRSSLEIKMKNFLNENNILYIHDKKLPEHEGMNSGFLRPDFLLLERHVIIECDGEYYHQDKEKDANRNKTYADLGYAVLCFSGQDIVNNWDIVESIILSDLETIRLFNE